jgi:vacuolar-type H+-ATPase subunit B/Vma2
MNRNYRKILLGLGFDSKDGHLRITKGENFRIFGGSEETHEMMQEKAIKFNEHLDKRRKNLEEINEDEFREISTAIGLKIPGEGKKGK